MFASVCHYEGEMSLDMESSVSTLGECMVRQRDKETLSLAFNPVFWTSHTTAVSVFNVKVSLSSKVLSSSTPEKYSSFPSPADPPAQPPTTLSSVILGALSRLFTFHSLLDLSPKRRFKFLPTQITKEGAFLDLHSLSGLTLSFSQPGFLTK